VPVSLSATEHHKSVNTGTVPKFSSSRAHAHKQQSKHVSGVSTQVVGVGIAKPYGAYRLLCGDADTCAIIEKIAETRFVFLLFSARLAKLGINSLRR